MPASSSSHLPQLNDDTLRAMAGDGAFSRGSKYAKEGRVELETRSEHIIAGTVRGTANYSATLHLDGESLHGTCNCPVGNDGDFCKHLVALALVAGGDVLPALPKDNQLSAFLRSQTADLLADKLLAFAAQYREVEKDLAFWHKSSQAGSSAELNKVIGTLLRGGSFVDYRKSFDYAHRVDQVTELLRGLVKKSPAQCMDAAEYALLRLFKTLERSDDSAGAISGAMSDLAKLHFKALSATSPDKKYGQRFLKLMMADGWSFLQLEQYRPVLGKQAWAEYGRCLEVAYAKLPPSAPRKSKFIFTSDDAERSHVTRLLEDWYALNDDRDALLVLKIKGLEQPWDYAMLIDQFRIYERHREALEWAEKSLRLFPDDARFYELLADCYRHDGCNEDADRILWQWFEKWPTAQHFSGLMHHAGKQVAKWRERAFSYLEQCEEDNLKQRQTRDHTALRDVSTRLDILLREKKVDEAVTISRNTLANGHLVLELANMARKHHPDVSIPIYRRHIENTIALGNNKAYESGIDYLRKLLPLFTKEDRNTYLQELHSQFKAKRNFIKLLEKL